MLTRSTTVFALGVCAGVAALFGVSLFVTLPIESGREPGTENLYRVPVFAWCRDDARELLQLPSSRGIARLVPAMTPYGSPPIPIVSIAEVSQRPGDAGSGLALAESLAQMCMRNTYLEVPGSSIGTAIERFERSDAAPDEVQQMIAIVDKDRDVVRIFSVPPIDFSKIQQRAGAGP